MITSGTNNKIKKISALKNKAKTRRDEKLFIVEGKKMFRETPGHLLHSVFVSKEFINDEKNRKELSKYDYEIVDSQVFKGISDMVTPQGILCIVKQLDYSLQEIIEKKNENGSKRCFIILENLRDPGNLGTIIRTAEAAGVVGIIMNKETADIYNPKVVRSTMGSIFRVPLHYTNDLESAILEMKKNKIKIFSTSLQAENNVFEKKYNEDSAFMIGNEANGLSDSICELSDELIKIPMEGKVESLNAAISAAVIMYHFNFM